MRSLFITGTDTNVGKTEITVELLKLCEIYNLSTIGLKPIASGCKVEGTDLISDDAIKICAASTKDLTPAEINPWRFEPPIAPHIAAEEAGKNLDANMIANYINLYVQQDVDIIIIEGAGGWQVPLNQYQTIADIVKSLQRMQRIEVILVVDIKLGCINHAILTYQSMMQHNINAAGWIANFTNANVTRSDQIIAYLESFLSIPLLGVKQYHRPMANTKKLERLLFS